MTNNPLLSHAQLLQLKRWNTPTVYNGWEQTSRCNAGRDGFNLEETRDFMPQMGPMVGYAVTDQSRLTVGGEYYVGPDDSFFGQFKKNHTAFVELQHFF